MGQFDIGFDTGVKKWFINSMTTTRWYSRVSPVENSNISLQNVNVDTYSWADQENIENTHGRLRFYEGNEMTTKNSDYMCNSIMVEGQNNTLDFVSYSGSNIEVSYNIPTMDWTLQVGDKKLITKNIIGNITGTIRKDKKRFVIKKGNVLHSSIVTLINTNLKLR